MMLQSLRDNLKGTVAIFVLAIFVIPLILFGVEQLFVGSVGGTDIAEVNGEGISRIELQRELTLEKQRLQQRFELEANNPQLEDSVLSGPVLQRMVQREALHQAALKGKMGVSKDELWKQIASIEAFQVDGKFDYPMFKERISYLYTPATFLEASEKDFVLGHLSAGISNTGFVTEKEMELLAAIMQQKRTFFAIEIPVQQAENVTVSAEEIEEFYSANSAQFTEPERVSIDYIDLNIEDLVKGVTVAEEDIQAIYKEETSDFKSDPKYGVAHILIEEKPDQESIVQQVSEKLAAGVQFAELAKLYSDDLGSKDTEGNLGMMVEEAYPKEFVEATKNLAVGAVSDPIKTEAGIHFIKLLDKTNMEAPSYEERKEAITQQLARQVAQDEYLKKIAVLDEKTFGADSLQYAAEALELPIQSSELFTRQGGEGIAAIEQLVSAAFEPDVLTDKQNSRVIEVLGERSVVMRIKEHLPEQIKPLASVSTLIKEQLTAQKVAAVLATKALELSADITAGKSAETAAKDRGLQYTLHENASRSSSDINNSVLQAAFTLARPVDGAPVLEQTSLPEGDVVVIGLQDVKNGSITDLADAQRSGLKGQLGFQLSQAELYSFENGIIEKTKVDMSE